MQFLTIRNSDTRVVGLQRGATAVPVNTADNTFVEADDTLIALFQSLQNQATADLRDADIRWNGTTVVLQSDTRIYVDIVADKTQVAADNVDFVTFTISALNADGSVDTAVNQTIIEEMTPGRFFQIQFINGVATKQVKFPDTGKYNIQSNNSVKVKTTIQITAYE